MLYALRSARPSIRRGSRTDTCRALMSLASAQVVATVEDCVVIRWSSTYIARAVGCAAHTALRIRDWAAGVLGGHVVRYRDLCRQLWLRGLPYKHLPSAADRYLVIPASARAGAMQALRALAGDLPAPRAVGTSLEPGVGLQRAEPGPCRCPYHDDRTASFSVFHGNRDGRLLGACHATDCGARSIVRLTDGFATSHRYDGRVAIRWRRAARCEAPERPVTESPELPRGGPVYVGADPSGLRRGVRIVTPIVRSAQRRVDRARVTGQQIDLDIRRSLQADPAVEIAAALGYNVGNGADPYAMPADRLLETCLSRVSPTDRPFLTGRDLGDPTVTDCVVLDLDDLQARPDDHSLEAIETALRAWGASRRVIDVRVQVTSARGLQVVLLLRRWVDAAHLYGSRHNAVIWHTVADWILSRLQVGGHLDTSLLRPGSCMRRPGWRVDKSGGLFRSYYVTGPRSPGHAAL